MSTYLLRRFVTVAILATITTSLLLIQSAPVRAGTGNISSPKLELAQEGPVQYAVKFICGIAISRLLPGPISAPGQIVAPGAYFTAINVHNPNSRALVFRKHLALPGPEPETPAAEPKKTFDAKLGPDQALEIDCPDIMRTLAAPLPPRTVFLKGFVVIDSDFELDVVAVYTAAPQNGQVVTMEIERVPARPRRP